jgi:tRNA(Ile)-lysidine synthase
LDTFVAFVFRNITRVGSYLETFGKVDERLPTMLVSLPERLRLLCNLKPDVPLVVGVSGGPDSLCLLDVLHSSGYPVIVAHFNHKLRLEADEDEAFVRKLAQRWRLPCDVDSANVGMYADEHSLSVEDAARLLRYRFLFQVARQNGAQAVAVGHTADDQAETVLMHFLRGAGLNGLRGMSYRVILPDFDPQIPLIRPLLDTWREDVLAHCAARGIHPRWDVSNDSPAYLRNRVRHILLPTLETYNPRIREALCRMAYILDGDYELLTEVLDKAWEAVCLEDGNGYVILDAKALRSTSAGYRRNLLRRAIKQIRPGLQNIDFAALERAMDLVDQRAGSRQMDLLAGIRLLVEGDRLYVATWEVDLPGRSDWPQIKLSVPPMSLVWPGTWEIAPGWTLKAERWQDSAQAWEQARDNANPYQAWLDADCLKVPLVVRCPRPGDRFQPLGMGGHTVKLSDFFINHKIPRRARTGWPLICSGEMIAWVPGFRPAHACRLRQETRSVLYLSLVHSNKE